MGNNGGKQGHSVVPHDRSEETRKYEDPNMLPKINKPDMAGTMEAIEEYLRSCQGDIWVPLTYIIKKTKKVQTYGDYPLYAVPDDKMIASMLHLLSDKNKTYNE